MSSRLGVSTDQMSGHVQANNVDLELQQVKGTNPELCRSFIAIKVSAPDLRGTFAKARNPRLLLLHHTIDLCRILGCSLT